MQLALASALVPPAASGERLPEWPAGVEVMRFENLEGVILVRCHLRGADRDTSGLMALDTGAGHLALDRPVAMRLGLLDYPPDPGESVGLAARPLARLDLGGRQMDQVSPIMTVDAEVVRSVTDRPVLGLLGASLFRRQALWIDFRERVLGLVPVAPTAVSDAIERDREAARGFPADDSPGMKSPKDPATAEIQRWKERVRASRGGLADVLGSRATAVPFVLEGDGKIVISARVAEPRPGRWSSRLDLILDTGATKTVLFAPTLGGSVRHAEGWRTLKGLSAPTLFGSEPAWVAMVPAIELLVPGGSVRRDSVDAAMLAGELGPLLARVTGHTIHGLLGYSFLRHFRVCVDYPHRVLWLERQSPEWNDHPYEYSQPGLQIERSGRIARIVAVATNSPAAEAGIAAGDELVSIEGQAADQMEIVDLARRLEGEPGSTVELVVRRDAREQRYRIVRRQLL